MILITYPINSQENQIIEHPDKSFRMFDTTNKEESKTVFMMLLAQFGNDISIYNMSSRSQSTFFNNIGNLFDYINNEDVSFENSWCVLLNLEEDEIRAMMNNYKRDFIIVEDGKPICFDNKEIVVYGDIECAYAEKHDGSLYCLLSIADPDNKELYDVHVFSFDHGIVEVHDYKAPKIDKEWFEISFDELSHFFGECEADKSGHDQVVYVTNCQYVNCRYVDHDSAPAIAAFDSMEKAKQDLNDTLEYVKEEFLDYYEEKELVIVNKGTYVEIHDVDCMDWWCGKLYETELK